MSDSPRVQKISGFTIVELLIVVVVIAILATITILSYNAITQRARETNIKTDLISYAKKLEVDKVVNGNFSSPVITNYLLSDTTNITTAYKHGNLTNFCMEGTSKSNSDLKFHIKTSEGLTYTQAGACPALANTGVASRCVSGNVVLAVSQTNYSSETVVSSVSTIYGNDMSTVAAGAAYSIAFSTRVTSIPRGLVTITLTGPTFAETIFHAYEPRSC